MKKLLFLLICSATCLYTFAMPPVSEKVLKMFASVFPTVQNAKWYENENYYEVYFDKDDVKCKLKFDHEGNILSTIRYYEEKNIAPYLKAKLAKKFPGKRVFGVTEMTSEEGLTYNFVLEDDKNWYHINSDAVGQMNISQKFKKAGE